MVEHAGRPPWQQRLIALPITPNAISLLGFVGNVIAAVLIWQEAWIAGGIAFALGSICDTLDGTYARMSGKGTRFGAFLDSTLDRIEEGIVLAAIAMVYARQGDELGVLLTVIAVIGSLLVSYTRARAEGLGLDGEVGIASRPVRVVILSAGLILGGNEIVQGLDLVGPAVWILAALGVVTTGQRMWHVRRQLQGPAGDGPPPAPRA